LIPANFVKESDFSKSSPKRVDDFKSELEKAGVVATVRRELGSDISASCGQLRRKHSTER
ncbi:MAG: 23S rRNA (adenine(2503)-C(2))-methyltransferase RlmN, partial [Clostridia bacterium]|nr:23S rRNA (adenine(2503)-C(2))-methyltransferase RlmN [Clostridia bacterium]